MEYSEDFPGDNAFVQVITGDGKNERRILRAMSHKYNGHDLTLYFPALPMSAGRTGIQNLLRGLRLIMTDEMPHVLLIIDREFIELTEVAGECAKLGVAVRVIQQDASYMEADFVAGAQGAHVYFVISGASVNIEEDIAALISRTLRVTIRPTKDAIKTCLRANGLRIDSLISEASVADLSQSFIGLGSAMSKIEENLGH